MPARQAGKLPEDYPLPLHCNIAFATFQPVIRLNRDIGERETVMMRWELVPCFARKLADWVHEPVILHPRDTILARGAMSRNYRVFGVFQNFYTSYIWEAAPMTAKQKYKLAFRTIVDPTTFVVLAGVAGAEQYNGTYPGYGPGIEGYGKRYGAALADSVSGRIIGSAVLPSLFHQDPCYFYQGSGGIRSRTCMR